MTIDLDFNVFAGVVFGLSLSVCGYLLGYAHCWWRMSGQKGRG